MLFAKKMVIWINKGVFVRFKIFIIIIEGIGGTLTMKKKRKI